MAPWGVAPSVARHYRVWHDRLALRNTDRAASAWNSVVGHGSPDPSLTSAPPGHGAVRAAVCMEWINELENEAWNTVIDELVWHLRHGRVPTIITRRFAPARGIEFRFGDAPAVFAPIDDASLEDHWDEASRIIGRFPQLNATRLRSDRSSIPAVMRAPGFA